MHLLAYKYHWGYGEIMSLTRSDRGLFYEMVRTQLEAERDSINESTQENTSSSKPYKESI